MDIEFDIPPAPAPTPDSGALDAKKPAAPEGDQVPDSSPGSLVPDAEVGQTDADPPASLEETPPVDGDKPPASEEPPEPKLKSEIQKRIDRLVWEKKVAVEQAATERVQRLQQEAQYAVQNRLAMVEQQEPQPEAFETLYEYQRSHSDWATARAVEVFEARRYLDSVAQYATDMGEQAKQRSVAEQFNRENEVIKAKLQPGLKKYPDLVATLENPELPSARGTPLFDAVLSADHSDDVAYTLAKNPEKYRQLLELSVQNPALAYKVIGKLDAKFASSAPKITSSAPPPPTEIRSGSTPPKRAQDMTDAEWIAKREADVQKRNRR